MERYEYEWISGHFRRTYSHINHERCDHIHGFEELVRLPVDIQHDPFGASQCVADDIKGSFGESAKDIGISQSC